MAPGGDTTDPRRELHLVENVDPVEPAPAPAQTAEPTPSSPTSYFTWLLLGATLLFGWLWLTQADKANGLAADLAGVESELVAAQRDIVAWEEHGANVQSGVEDLATQLGALQELLRAAPTSETEFALESNSEAGIEQEAAPAD